MTKKQSQKANSLKIQQKKSFIEIYIFSLIVFEILFKHSKIKLSKIIFFVIKKKCFILTYFFVVKYEKKIIYYK